MTDAHDISIVILTYNRQDCVRELLEEIRGYATRVREVIVVNNCSPDGTGEMLDREFPEFRQCVTERNEGVAARNLGVRSAKGEVVVTLDDDVMGLDPDDLAWLEEQFSQNETLGALNFKVMDWDVDRVVNWVHHRPGSDANLRFPTYEITEGAVAFRRSAFVAAGGYFERFFISHEGPDLAYRLMNRDFDVIYDGRVAVRHKHETGARDPWRFYYYDTRNQFWLAARNMPLLESTRYLIRGLGSMGVYALRDGFFGWYLRGVRDGIRGLGEAFQTREVWSRRTAELCREIDRHRASLGELLRSRLLNRNRKLEG